MVQRDHRLLFYRVLSNFRCVGSKFRHLGKCVVLNFWSQTGAVLGGLCKVVLQAA